MAKVPTIKTVASRAGVSPATVSRVLNNNPSVSPETRDRVLRAARELDFVPNLTARALTAKKTFMLGVILPALSGEFFTELVCGIDQVAYGRGYHVVVSSSHSHRTEIQTLAKLMSQGRVDGLIVMEPLLGKQALSSLNRLHVPVIVLNYPWKGEKVQSILIDNYRGAYLVTKHLLEHGYAPVAMIRGPSGNFDAETRERGYRQALREHGHDPDAQGGSYLMQGNFDRQSGYLAMSMLLGMAKPPRAVFAANDEMALGAYGAIADHGLSIPDDVAVVGFDDIDVASSIRPPLTTVHVPITQLGCLAAERLITAIEQKEELPPAQETVLSTGLVIRESCGCPKHRG
ncbi:MAG: LacI family DNA-binding transcriptional regulator [Candidatus Oleimicrobiaceae bacterium]